MMTWTIFDGRTAKLGRNVRARGKNLAKVDKALKAYWAKMGAANAQARAGLISAVVVECEKWLKKKSVCTGTGSELFQRRRGAIRDLGTGALQDLLVLQPNALADISFSQRKIDALGSGNMREAKGLEGGYSNEREDYLKNKKTAAPISGSRMHMVHKNIDAIAPGQNALKAKRFEELTLADFQLLNKLAVRDGSGFDGAVDFLTKADRKSFIAIPQGGIFVNGAGAPVNAPNPVVADGRFPFAMDVYGNFFTKDENVTKANVQNFNHSSFNAGKSVICAGMCKIQNGNLLWIDNSSGHYKPTKQNLHNLVCQLAQDGIDISRAAVGLYDFTTGAQKVYLYRASSFLNDVNYQFAVVLNSDQEIYQQLSQLSANNGW